MNKEELRSLFFDDADVLFQIFDEHLNCIDVNKKTLQLFNLSLNQIIGKNIKELAPDAVESGRYAAYQKVLATGESMIIEDYKTQANGQTVYFRIRVFKLGKGVGMVSKNVTDLEQKLRHSNAILKLKLRDLDAANIENSKMLKTLINQNQQLSDFCNIVSHNLRAPLVNLSILSDYITNCKDVYEREIMFQKISPVIRNLNETFDNLVESLQIREDVGLKLDENNLDEITSTVLEKHQIEIDLYQARIDKDFTEAPIVHYPKNYLDSILSNLISNALKYRSENRMPHISIKTNIRDNRVQLLVSDNGLGIDLVKYGHQIFKMRKVFHMHPDAKGYGLFLTKTQVEAMGGEIYVDSKPNVGSTFTIIFNENNTYHEKNK